MTPRGGDTAFALRADEPGKGRLREVPPLEPEGDDEPSLREYVDVLVASRASSPPSSR